MTTSSSTANSTTSTPVQRPVGLSLVAQKLFLRCTYIRLQYYAVYFSVDQWYCLRKQILKSLAQAQIWIISERANSNVKQVHSFSEFSTDSSGTLRFSEPTPFLCFIWKLIECNFVTQIEILSWDLSLRNWTLCMSNLIHLEQMWHT